MFKATGMCVSRLTMLAVSILLACNESRLSDVYANGPVVSPDSWHGYFWEYR